MTDNSAMAPELRDKIQSLIDARIAAREGKDFATSDRIRDELVAMGVVIMDAKDPVTGETTTTWEIKLERR